MEHHKIHAVVELASHGSEKTASGLKVAKAIAASEAFRKYNWLKNVPGKNISGNLRGMVVSKRWAAMFDFAEDALKPIEKIAVLAGLAENLAKSYDTTETILKGSDSWDNKAARLSTEVSSVMIRTVAGAIPAGAHVLAAALSGYVQMAGLAGSHKAWELNGKLKSLDAKFTSAFEKVTDGGNMHIFINKYLVIQ